MNLGTVASAYSTFYLFATAMAVGVMSVLPFVPLKIIGQRFFILMGLMALAFVALATVSEGLGVSVFYLVFAALAVVYSINIPKQPGVDRVARSQEAPTPAAWLSLLTVAGLYLCVASGTAALISDALTFPHEIRVAGATQPWLIALFLTSSLLLGAAVNSMVLGHWYLVGRGFSFGPLKRLTIVLGVAVVLRSIVVVAAGLAQSDVWKESFDEAGLVGFFLADGVFVIARLMFGIVLPLFMTVFVWGCLKVKSNQSATGILYVIVVFVLIGEILAKYYLLTKSYLL